MLPRLLAAAVALCAAGASGEAAPLLPNATTPAPTTYAPSPSPSAACVVNASRGCTAGDVLAWCANGTARPGAPTLAPSVSRAPSYAANASARARGNTSCWSATSSNVQGIDASDYTWSIIGTSAVLFGGAALALALLFEGARHRKRAVYSPRRKALRHRVPSARRERGGVGYGAWILPVARMSGRDTLAHVGLDGYMLLRTMRLFRRACLFDAFWGLAVLVPIYATGDHYQVTRSCRGRVGDEAQARSLPPSHHHKGAEHGDDDATNHELHLFSAMTIVNTHSKHCAAGGGAPAGFAASSCPNFVAAAALSILCTAYTLRLLHHEVRRARPLSPPLSPALSLFSGDEA